MAVTNFVWVELDRAIPHERLQCCLKSLSTFADDTKIYSRVNNNGDIKKLQQDIDNLLKWSQVWQMPSTSQNVNLFFLAAVIQGMSTPWAVIILSKLVKKKIWAL